MMRPRDLVSVTLLLLGLMCVLAGRIETMHLTEGEALIEGWHWWVGTFVLCGLGLFSINRKG